MTGVIKKRNPYVLKIHKRIETSFLNLPSLNEDQEKRLKEILKLHQDEYTNRQISDQMNKKYKKTIFHNKTYTPKLIWVTLKKYKKRLERINNYSSSFEYVELVREV